MMKKERNLLKLLTNEECLDASRKAFSTADIHKKSADTLSKDGHYGIPVAHLVLSTEQTVVGMLLYLQHLGLNVRNIAGVHLFFTDHIIKHRLATLINVMYPAVKLLVGLVQKEREKIHNPDASIEYTDDEEALMSKDEKRIQNMFKDLPGMLDWWDDANVQKNKGFYVDYSTSLESPMEVTESEYTRAFGIVDNFQKQILETVSYLDSATEADKQEIKRNSKKYGIDKILAPVIEARKNDFRDKDKDPTDIIEEFMSKAKNNKRTKKK